jgi:hypothetical protein
LLVVPFQSVRDEHPIATDAGAPGVVVPLLVKAQEHPVSLRIVAVAKEVKYPKKTRRGIPIFFLDPVCFS